MTYLTPDDLIKVKLAEAEARGLARPVLLLLGQDTAPARAIFADLNGREMRRAPVKMAEGEEAGQVEAVSVERAAVLLRRHARSGGAVAARLLKAAAGDAGWFVVVVRGGGIWVRAFARCESLDSPSLGATPF
jgi:hypothetical protein